MEQQKNILGKNILYNNLLKNFTLETTDNDKQDKVINYQFNCTISNDQVYDQINPETNNKILNQELDIDYWKQKYHQQVLLNQNLTQANLDQQKQIEELQNNITSKISHQKEEQQVNDKMNEMENQIKNLEKKIQNLEKINQKLSSDNEEKKQIIINLEKKQQESVRSIDQLNKIINLNKQKLENRERLRYFDNSHMEKQQQDLHLSHQDEHDIYLKKIGGSSYLVKVYHYDVISYLGWYAQSTLNAIIVSQLDQNIEGDSHFVKIKGISIKEGDQKYKWAEFYQTLKCDLEGYLYSLEKSYVIERFFIAWRLARAVRIIHENNMIHGNLAIEDIFVDEKNLPLIFNFNSIKFLDKGVTKVKPAIINYIFSAPEVLNEQVMTQSSDIWSLGSILIQVFIRTTPWFRIKKDEDMLQIRNQYLSRNQGPLEQHDDVCKEKKYEIRSDIREILAECLKINPQERIKARDLEMKLEQLYQKQLKMIN